MLKGIVEKRINRQQIFDIHHGGDVSLDYADLEAGGGGEAARSRQEDAGSTQGQGCRQGTVVSTPTPFPMTRAQPCGTPPHATSLSPAPTASASRNRRSARQTRRCRATRAASALTSSRWSCSSCSSGADKSENTQLPASSYAGPQRAAAPFRARGSSPKWKRPRPPAFAAAGPPP